MYKRQLQGTLVSLSFMVLMTVANGVAGLTGSAALSIAGKVNSVAILPSLAMQASVSSMAGQNIGAGKPERAKKTMFVAMGMSFVFSALMFAVVNLFPAGIASLFMLSLIHISTLHGPQTVLQGAALFCHRTADRVSAIPEGLLTPVLYCS